MNPFKRLAPILIILLVVVVTGTIGYQLIEGWPFLDSIYMVIITLFTVGFQEVHSLSQFGRVFTMFIIVVGVGTAVYAGSLFFIGRLAGHSTVIALGRISSPGEFSHFALMTVAVVCTPIYQGTKVTLPAVEGGQAVRVFSIGCRPLRAWLASAIFRLLVARTLCTAIVGGVWPLASLAHSTWCINSAERSLWNHI